MAKFDYARLTALAEEKIYEFGTDIYLQRDSSTVWEKKYDREALTEYWENTSTGAIVFVEPTDTDSFLGDGVITRFKTEEIDGHLIQQDDRLIIATKLPVPKLGDVILIGTTEYKYIKHWTVAPNNETIVYRIQARI